MDGQETGRKNKSKKNTSGQTDGRTDGQTDERTDRRTNRRTNERTQTGVAELASQITDAECRVRQTHARSEFIYKMCDRTQSLLGFYSVNTIFILGYRC